MGSETRASLPLFPLPIVPPRFHFPPLPSLPTTQQHDYNKYSIAKAIHN